MRYVVSAKLVAIFQLGVCLLGSSLGVACLALPAGAETSTAAQPEPVASAPAEAVDERSAGENLLQKMTSQGIRLTDDQQFKMPPPTFVSITGQAVDVATARQALAEIAGRHSVSQFARDSIVAPIFVKIDSINNPAGERIGHFIDVAFVVQQSIAKIRNSKALEDFKSNSDDEQGKNIEFADQDNPDELEKNKTRSLTKRELAEHGIALEDQYEALGWMQMPLLSNVVIRGVARARRSVWSNDDEDAPVILTWLLDSRFGSDTPQAESIANQWSAIERTSTGEKFLGPPHPYAGMGGYVAITPLPDQPHASLVQLRFVIHEPREWFAGRNLLRSKLPILIQDRVRNLRRELQEKP